MKKILSILALIPAVIGAYFLYDYAAYMLKPRNEIKKILLISEQLVAGTTRNRLVELIQQEAPQNARIQLEVVDISTLGFSFITGHDAPAEKASDNNAIQRWSARVAAADGIIFLVPNYNNGYPAGIKNSIDVLWKEWHNKPTSIVAYSVTYDDSTAMIQAFERVLHKIKSDPVKTVVYVAPEKLKKVHQGTEDPELRASLQTMINELYAGANERNYLRQLYRSTTDKMLRALIRAFKHKKK